MTGLEEMVLLGLIESEGVRERREAMDCREERETVSGEIACWRFVEREGVIFGGKFEEEMRLERWRSSFLRILKSCVDFCGCGLRMLGPILSSRILCVERGLGFMG